MEPISRRNGNDMDVGEGGIGGFGGGGEDKTGWGRLGELLVYQAKQMEKKVEQLEANLRELDKKIDLLFLQELTQIKIEMARFETKLTAIIAIASVIAGTVSGIVVLVVSYFINK